MKIGGSPTLDLKGFLTITLVYTQTPGIYHNPCRSVPINLWLSVASAQGEWLLAKIHCIHVLSGFQGGGLPCGPHSLIGLKFTDFHFVQNCTCFLDVSDNFQPLYMLELNGLFFKFQS